MLASGQAFPDAPLPGIDGGAAPPLSALWATEPVLVVIGHRTCSTTRLALPFLDRIHRRGPKGVVVALLQDTPENAEGLRAEQSLELPVRLDLSPYDFAARLGITTVPTLFLI